MRSSIGDLLSVAISSLGAAPRATSVPVDAAEPFDISSRLSMPITRRTFAGALAAAPYILRGQTGDLKARIKIDTERTIGEIDPKIYGNFIEHLGRCIDGGIFDEKSPLSDSDGFRRDVLDAVRKL